MVDEREGVPAPPQAAANQNRAQTGGRSAADDRGRPERYPAVDRCDAVQDEHRSFDPVEDALTPRQGARGDPAEGKR